MCVKGTPKVLKKTFHFSFRWEVCQIEIDSRMQETIVTGSPLWFFWLCLWDIINGCVQGFKRLVFFLYKSYIVIYSVEAGLNWVRVFQCIESISFSLLSDTFPSADFHHFNKYWATFSVDLQQFLASGNIVKRYNHHNTRLWGVIFHLWGLFTGRNKLVSYINNTF